MAQRPRPDLHGQPYEKRATIRGAAGPGQMRKASPHAIIRPKSFDVRRHLMTAESAAFLLRRAGRNDRSPWMEERPDRPRLWAARFSNAPEVGGSATQRDRQATLLRRREFATPNMKERLQTLVGTGDQRKRSDLRDRCRNHFLMKLRSRNIECAFLDAPCSRNAAGSSSRALAKEESS